MDFDLILAGGGLANGLIALRLAQLGPGRHDFGALLLADSRR